MVGTVKAYAGEFSTALPNGSSFIDWKDRNRKSRVLNLGSVRDASDGGRLFVFYDFPQSNVLNTKPTVALTIDDRNNYRRFLFEAETEGIGQVAFYNKAQQELMKLYEDGNDNVYMHFPKPNSRVVIANWGNYLPEHKFVVSGSAKIEGNILTDANIGIGTSNFTDGSDTYKLSVKGKVRAEEVKVYNTWADYVFAKNYDLKPLTKVESTSLKMVICLMYRLLKK
ncbi:hypothetical protein [Flavobacterium sp. LM4]|uniref:hypothetical protein n=1 Tax=Flavobacterium sp. LM4 TaxID=1938609 RepID=UPI000991ED47|nr:hypothetical protein [Flavobacterium sp. LM4]OOV12339.1 hypothetical protein BXU10_24540 [Flavobacterium sp. LM4]